MAKYNSVPLGQAGTGSAFILGQDTASTNFNRNLNAQRTVDEQRRLEAERKAQLLAKSYRDNLLAASDGKLFAKQLGELEQKHLAQGMQYRGQGFDIYNPDPNDKKQLDAANQYMGDRRTIENLRAYRKGIEDNYKTNSLNLSKGKVGEYNQQDVDAMNKFVGEGNLLDYYNSGATLPQLRKNFNLSESLKGIKAPTFEKQETKNGVISDIKYIDKEDAENTVLGVLGNTIGGQEELARVTQGLPINEVRRLPNKLEDIKKTILQDANGDPNLKTALAENQVKIGTPAFDKWADKEAKRLYDIKKNFNSLLEGGVSQISAGANLFDKKKNEMTEYQRQQLALARQRENRIASAEGKADDDVLYRQQLIDDMFSGVAGSGEKVSAIVQGQQGYQGKGLQFDLKGNNITIRVPEKIKETENADGEVKTTIIPSYSITVDRTKPQDRDKLNQLLNDVTGEKINNSKYQTGQPSGKVKGSTVSERVGGAKEKSMVTMVLPNGSTGQVPSDQVGAFLKKYPKARKK